VSFTTISKAEFDDAKQEAFQQALADASSVALSKVKIANIKSITSRRRHLLAEGIAIDVEITATDTQSAASVASKLTGDNVNDQLAKAGLPEAEVSSPQVVTEEAQDISSEEEPSNPTPIIVAVVSSVSVLVCSAVMLVLFRRRRALGKADLHANLDLHANPSVQEQADILQSCLPEVSTSPRLSQSSRFVFVGVQGII